MSRDDIIFQASDGEIIRTSVFGKENIGSGPVVVMAHGFKGFKDWGFWPYIGEYFAERGFVAVTFNFSHNGVGESLTEFDQLDKFADNTFSREVRELRELVAAVNDGFFGDIGGHDIGVLGHSRGGGIALAASAKDDLIIAVATWSAVADFNRYSDEHKKRWREKGYFEVLNTRTNQMMRLNSVLLEDLEEHGDDLLNLERAARGLGKPLLIVHGAQDVAVPIQEGKQLREWADDENTEFFRVENTGHTFGAVHPFEGTTDALESVLEKTTDFFGKNLR